MERPKVAQEFGAHVKSNDTTKLSISKEIMLASADCMVETIASMVYTETPVLWSHAMTALLLKYIVRALSVSLSEPFQVQWCFLRVFLPSRK